MYQALHQSGGLSVFTGVMFYRVMWKNADQDLANNTNFISKNKLELFVLPGVSKTVSPKNFSKKHREKPM